MRNIMKKMRVFNDAQDSETRYVVHIEKDGSCLAVFEAYENQFVNRADGIKFGFWDSCEEIIENGYRPFNNGEMDQSYLFYKYRLIKSDFIMIPIVFDGSDSDTQLRFAEEWKDNEQLFKEYEVFINGSWIPVGVKN